MSAPVTINVYLGDPDGTPKILTAISDLKGLLVNDQQKLDALATALGTLGTQLSTAATGLAADIAALKNVPPGTPLDFTSVDAKLASIQTATQALNDLDAANPPPATP